jgi:hypothetical protein
MSKRRLRKTSRYTIVIHDVTTTEARIWVGALLPSLGKPLNWRLVIRKVIQGFGVENEDCEIVKKREYLNFDKKNWERPFKGLNRRFYRVETIDGLEPGQDYTVEFLIRSENEWRLMETAFFTTLPLALPNDATRPFTVGVGSCFYTKHDGGRVGRSWEALFKHQRYKPDIKFLTGDQVYTDIGLGWYPLNKKDCLDRVADDYAESWELLRSMLRRGGTWMLSDDHEYWNNFPFLDGFNPYLVTLKLSKSFKKRREYAARQGVENVQQITQAVRSFDIGTDLSFCIADLRSERSDNGFLSDTSFDALLTWVRNLTTPGVLAIPQPLIAGHGDKNDKNLPDWTQYDQLLREMQIGQHDIVVLTGDVHYGRVAQVNIGSSNNKLVEVIASPMSNLSELNGIATASPNLRAKKFPLENVSQVPKNQIKYLGKVTTESKWWDLRFPSRRTTEHFMTVDFFRDAGTVKMKVNAWDARNANKSNGFPKKVRKFNIKPIELN